MSSERERAIAETMERLKLTEVLFLSKGGQGSTTAVGILARALGKEDKYYSVTFNARGQVRMGPTIQTMRISDTPDIPSSLVIQPNHLVMFDESPLTALDALYPEILLAFKKGLMIVNSSRPASEIRHPYKFEGEVIAVNATKIAMDTLGIQPPPVGVPLIAAYAGATALVSFDSLAWAVEYHFSHHALHPIQKSSLVPKNLEAAKQGYEAGKKAKQVKSAGEGKKVTILKLDKFEELRTGGDVYDVDTALPPYSSGKNPFIWRQSVPVWINSKCSRCEYCYSLVFCPDWCFSYQKKGGAYEQRYDVRIDLDYCKGCYVCADVCPFKAIEMRPEAEVLGVAKRR